VLKYANIIGTILILFGLMLPVSAQEKFFKNRLILPPLKGFEVFAQTMDDNAAQRVKKSPERWNVDDASKSLNKSSVKRYLLVNDKENIWIALNLHHTEFGGKASLDSKRFRERFVALLKKSGVTVGASKSIRSNHAGEVGYILVKNDKVKGYATHIIYIPAISTGHLGDNRAYTIDVTYTKDSSEQAKEIVKKLLAGMKVSKS